MATFKLIKEDGFIKVDNVKFLGLDCSSIDSNIHAIEFDGTTGHVEYNDGTHNLIISNINAYSVAQGVFDTAVADAATATADAATAASEAATAQTALEATYAWKRVNDSTTKYASIGDQLDQQYKDAVNGTTTWKDAIAAVKTAHPKP
mgnify:CR=1 FL=1|tara:strand:- start:46 stop:489 length:444 start_codon:yes stop_codon:yes gene_type:complete